MEKRETSRSGIGCRLVTEYEEFLSFKKEWNCLLSDSSSDTIFLTWEWLDSWWRAYGRGKELHIVVAEKNGRIVGIAPLYSQQTVQYGLIPCTVLRFLGDGSYDSDYLDFIVRRGDEKPVVTSLLEFLVRDGRHWDVMLLREIPETSNVITIMRSFFEGLGWYWEKVEDVPCTFVNLPADWDGYLSMLRPRMRTKIRSVMRRLEKEHEVSFDMCRNISDLSMRLESLFELHNRRWRSVGKPGVFESSEKTEFYNLMASAFHSRGWLRFYSLSVDGKYAAHQFCFEYGNTMFLLQEGYNPEMADLEVGNVLRGYVFRDCIERRVSVYDFLGGVTRHKLSWGGNVKNSLRFSIGSRSIKNRICYTLPKVVGTVKNSAKKVLPGRVIDVLKAARSMERP